MTFSKKDGTIGYKIEKRREKERVMKKGRSVYLVKGSEDGVIAVYSSRVKAVERAVQYVLDYTEDTLTPVINKGKWMTFVSAEGASEGAWVDAEVEKQTVW